jgi:hypothetical protein
MKSTLSGSTQFQGELPKKILTYFFLKKYESNWKNNISISGIFYIKVGCCNKFLPQGLKTQEGYCNHGCRRRAGGWVGRRAAGGRLVGGWWAAGGRLTGGGQPCRFWLRNVF